MTFYRRVAAAQNTQVRRVEDRLRRIQSGLPAEVPLSEVSPILVLLEAEALRAIASVLTKVLAQLGGRVREIKAAQRYMERVKISPRATTVVQEEAEAVLAQLAQARAYYARTLRLIRRLAPPKRDAVITAEARQLFERLTRAGSVEKGRRLSLWVDVLVCVEESAA